MSDTYKNIKIPYASEGVIRTAALDDTVAPENSAQIAVNMNFDRIGAFQTRKGITNYADQLIDPIRNFGTLNNFTYDSGFDSIVKLGDPTTFDAVAGQYMSAVKVDSTHALVFWQGASGDGFAQIMEINITTGAITPKGTPLEFDTSDDAYNACIKIDATHYLNIWTGPSGDGFAQVFAVNTTTWAVTAIGSPLEFDTADMIYPSVAQVDSSHFIIFYSGTASVGIAVVLKTDLGTFAVTQPGSPTTFDATLAVYNSCVAVGDGSHFINFWLSTASAGKARTFEVNLSTWAITGLSTALTTDAAGADYNSCASLGDGLHFINFWRKGSNANGQVRVYAMDAGTFAITAAGAQLEFDIGTVSYNSCVAAGDGESFINFWQGASNRGYTQIFHVDPLTFDIDALNSPVFFGLVDGNAYNSAVLMSSTIAVNFYSFTGTLGNGQVFQIRGPVLFNHYLYAQDGVGDVYNTTSGTWVLRRTGLSTESKARFAQFLNYIWMVNGNSTVGGPVMTSNGGDFGTTLVPVDFPPGDFIEAGFEGRVWVADRVNDVIYFTDIVQFTPPDTYTLTYDPDVNFIKNFSPQNGQTFTGLFTTPRALLAFKQDSIYRIYGAFSVDAYPAYNVGTYSQESIVQTKDGIFFHHSSGFYKFSYDSQPVEISRRVIDFIQAIPRDYYPEVKGIYNGYDAVEWFVGEVTVEGVTYTHCMMRYTISTQVWTIYDYPGNDITALISYDDGSRINMIVGAGQTL